MFVPNLMVGNLFLVCLMMQPHCTIGKLSFLCMDKEEWSILSIILLNLGVGGGAMGLGSRELSKHFMTILCGRWVVGAFSLQTKPLEP